MLIQISGISRFRAPGPCPPRPPKKMLLKMLLVKMFSLKRKTTEILAAIVEIVNFCLSKKMKAS